MDAHDRVGGKLFTLRDADRWAFTRGDFTTRARLHHLYGGSTQLGIAPTSRSTHVFLFSGARRDLWDTGWKQDGFYYYAGQALRTGGGHHAVMANAAIETAWSKGRRLQVLEMPDSGGLLRFVDSFVLDGVEELRRPGPGGRLVNYPLYRLRSIDSATHQPGQFLPPGDPRRVDVRRVERCDLLCRDAGDISLNGERPETRLSKAFERYVMSQGYAVHRLGIRHTADCTPMLTDTWIGQLHVLIEAKAGTNATNDVRMAVGQLYHYTRHTPDVLRKAILLPERPDDELLEFATGAGIEVIWAQMGEWCTTAQWGPFLGIKKLALPNSL